MPTIKHTRESIAELEQEREQYKQQRDELSEKLDKECNDNYKLEGQLHDMTKQRDSLIKDVEKLRGALIKTQNLADELMDIQVKYMNLTEHIKDKALHNPSVSRYIDLVHVIDELEKERE
ncbi:hypothetical protein HB162lentus_04480 [Mammaliicoccus lentus]